MKFFIDGATLNQPFFSEDSGSALLQRAEVESKYTWNLTDIFASPAEWEAAYENIQAGYPKLALYKGTLLSSGNCLLEFLQLKQTLEILFEKLYLYASLQKDLNLANGEHLSLYDRVSMLAVKFSEALAFYRPEILSVNKEEFDQIISGIEEFSIYRRYFDVMFREKEHTLSREIEEILAGTSEMRSLPYNVFSILMNANIVYPEVADENGKLIRLSAGRYSSSLYSKERAFRERVYRAYYGKIAEFSTTLATILSGSIKGITFTSRVRKYGSALEAALSPNEIPVSVYENLLQSVNNNLAPLHRWISLKAQLMGVEKISPYDMYVSHFDNPLDKKYTIEEGMELCLNAMKPLGEEYLSRLKTAFENRWLDVYETQGKRSGAYSSGTTYGAHPYVLLNWNGTLNDVFTLAHEMGHCLHSAYTISNQPFVYADYTIFVAEVASTLNENFLLDYLVEHNTQPAVKAFLLERFLNDMTATFYRQVMFAEFEKLIYEAAASGIAKSAEDYGTMYCALYAKYNGNAMLVEEEEKISFARIPHFYYHFYVYQYATGIAASLALTDRIVKEGENAVQDYLTFLKSGSSADPITLLRRAGVDMSTSSPVERAISKMNDALDELETLLPQMKR